MKAKNKIRFMIFLILTAFLLLTSCENDAKKNTSCYLEGLDLSEEQVTMVTEILGMEKMSVTEEDLASVRQITVAGRQIADGMCLSEFGGTEYCVQGKQYPYEEGYGNELSVLAFFANLEELQILYAPALTDAAFLSSLSQLRTLNLCMTNIRDLSSLASLEKLTDVTIEVCPVETIAFHPDNRMNSVSLRDTRIGDASVFGTLSTNMTSLAIARHQVPVGNLDILERFTALDSLYIGIPDADLSFMKEMTAPLTYISVEGMDAPDLQNLQAFADTLTGISLRDVSCVDLTPLDLLPHLDSISMFHVTDPVRGEKTQKDSDSLEADVDMSLNFFKWFSYDETDET